MVQYKQLCIDAAVQHLKKSRKTATEMVHARPASVWELHGSRASVRVGSWVQVIYDYSPGTCSDGGIGVVVHVTPAVDPEDADALLEDCMTVDVKYLMFGRTEQKIPLTRITIINVPFKQGGSTRTSLRPRSNDGSVERKQGTERDEESGFVAEQSKSPLEWLKFGLASRRHEKKGWLRDVLVKEGQLADDNESLWERVVSDHKCQLAARDTGCDGEGFH